MASSLAIVCKALAKSPWLIPKSNELGPEACRALLVCIIARQTSRSSSCTAFRLLELATSVGHTAWIAFAAANCGLLIPGIALRSAQAAEGRAAAAAMYKLQPPARLNVRYFILFSPSHRSSAFILKISTRHHSAYEPS